MLYLLIYILYVPLLSFFLVLGQVPGTNLVITYSEIEAVIYGLILYAVWKMHEKEYRRWLKWAWYRLGVNYRQQKRHAKAVIRYKRYRLAMWERRQIRAVKYFFRRQWRLLLLNIYRTRRRINLKVIRTRNQILRAIQLEIRRTKRGLGLAIARIKRQIRGEIYRFYSFHIKRRFYVKQVQIERQVRKFKRSRPVQAFTNLGSMPGQSV